MTWKAWPMLVLALLSAPCTTVQNFQTERPYQDCMPANWGLTRIQQCGAPELATPTLLYVIAFEETWNKTAWLPQNKEGLRAALNGINLHRQAGIFYSPYAEEKRRLLGLTYSPAYGRQQMYVAKLSNRLEFTALGHELIHVGYLATSGDAKRDHFGDEFEWPPDHIEFLKRVEQLYRKKLDGQLEDLRIQRQGS